MPVILHAGTHIRIHTKSETSFYVHPATLDRQLSLKGTGGNTNYYPTVPGAMQEHWDPRAQGENGEEKKASRREQIWKYKTELVRRVSLQGILWGCGHV